MKLATVQFEVDDVLHKFEVVHNLDDCFGLSIEGAVNSWVVRTNDFSCQSFCDYINSKAAGFHAEARKPWHIKP